MSKAVSVGRRLWAIGACLWFATAALAQTVRVANHGAQPFVGWQRTTVDTEPALAAGRIGDTIYVRGRRVGLDVWIVDLRLTLAAGEQRSLDLGAAVPALVPNVALPADPLQHFGGVPTVGGVPLQVVSMQVDGAAILLHGRCRTNAMLHVDVWLQWYPDEPGLVVGEAVATASNGSIPDWRVTVPAGGLQVAWGDALVHVVGAGLGQPLVPGATRFADGQARAVPFVLFWPRHLTTSDAWVQVIAAAERSTCATGIARLWPQGNPSYPASFDAAAWTASLFGEALRRLHTWEPGVIGPNANSGDTGTQWDQVHVCGEYALPGGTGAEQVAYLSALKLAARPCHHLEADGRQADPIDHPQCVFWSGRPHWHPVVSPDQLGKTQGISIADTNGWMGPDREHWLYNTVAAAARLTGSPALQWELGQQARLFLFGETVAPGYSTSGPDAARSIGWAGILVVHLWRNLEDRALAKRVADRWRDRVSQVYVPALWNRPYDVWDVRVGDPRLGPGQWWMAWQQSIGSYGLDLACEVLDIPQGRELALKGAKTCLESNWILQGTRYHGIGNVLFPPPPARDYARHAWPPPWFETTWDLPALAVVLRHEPGNPKANAVWRQALGDLGDGRRAWVPPGIGTP
ncbi:MAG: hypothetical protein JNM25_00335 [Planctomycetes bacterium]|nr:hypothetical protein [Planctomycetota bacterium]